MTCDPWTEKLDAYLDGELAEADARALVEHIRACPACTAEMLNRVQLKRAVHSAGRRFTPDPAFRARIEKNVSTHRPAAVRRLWIAVLAGCMFLIGAFLIVALQNSQQRAASPLLGELADLHVATLASANPVDVVSTDRHTVKPWFEGKIPFTFNLPELQDSPFTLVGGKVSYLHQSPGAELIFRIRQHQISVFIVQERGLGNMRAEGTANSFNVRSWTQNGLRYFVIGDVAAPDLDKLSDLLKSAG